MRKRVCCRWFFARLSVQLQQGSLTIIIDQGEETALLPGNKSCTRWKPSPVTHLSRIALLCWIVSAADHHDAVLAPWNRLNELDAGTRLLAHLFHVGPVLAEQCANPRGAHQQPAGGNEVVELVELE